MYLCSNFSFRNCRVYLHFVCNHLQCVSKNQKFSLKIFPRFQKKFRKKNNQYLSKYDLYLHLICSFCILELHQLNYDWVSEYSGNQLKRPVSGRVKTRTIINNQPLLLIRKVKIIVLHFNCKNYVLAPPSCFIEKEAYLNAILSIMNLTEKFISCWFS